jgi:hypothetical protein
MPASHFDVNSMTGRPKFIVRHSTTSVIYATEIIIDLFVCIYENLSNVFLYIRM